MLYGKSVATATQHGLVDEKLGQIVLVAPRSTLFQGLAHALDQQVDACAIRFAASDDTASVSPAALELVLLYACPDCNIRDTVESWRKRVDNTPIAVIVPDMASICEDVEKMLHDRQLQGVLPLTLELEVWLSAVLLLLHGGEYLPVRHDRPSASTNILPLRNGLSKNGDDPEEAYEHSTRSEPLELEPTPAPPPELATLTHREQEVLELLSQGYQNKLIAHRMSLSQHTVKVHVHNLLAKLRVNNRTQAAAMFRYDAPRPRHNLKAEDREDRFAR